MTTIELMVLWNDPIVKQTRTVAERYVNQNLWGQEDEMPFVINLGHLDKQNIAAKIDDGSLDALSLARMIVDKYLDNVSDPALPAEIRNIQDVPAMHLDAVSIVEKRQEFIKTAARRKFKL